MQVSRAIRAQRERLGLSQEALAERIYVSRQTVSNWECGRTYPDIESLLLMAQLFDVTLDELVKGDEEVMDEVIERDRKLLYRLGWAMAASLAVGMAGLVTALVIHEIPFIVSGFIWFIVFWGLSLIFGRRIDRIEKDNDLITYGEIRAFMNDGTRKTDAAGRLIPSWKRNLAKGSIGAIVGLLFALLVDFIVFVVFA